MHLIYLFFIAVINSVDNMGVRVAYSIGGIKVQLFKNILISLMAFAVAFSASFSGGIISKFMSEQASSIASMILLVFMGLKIIIEPYFKKKDEDIYNTKVVSYREAISVGTALALDDIGGAVSVGLMGFNPFIVGLAFFVVSFLIFLLGNYAIRLFAKLKIGNKATILSGILMILIGISQIID